MKRTIIILLFSLLLQININSQDHKESIYFQNDSIKLQMDIFFPESQTEVPKPVILFAHGGGFSKGNRQAGYGFCKFMAQNGYVACSIDYSLFMKGKSFSCNGITWEKIKAIQIAANDMWLATSFLLQNSIAFNIDSTKIFICGSSAGAEASLHTAYLNREKYTLYDHQLPQQFKYAGVIAGAGALIDINLINKYNLIPIKMFHGTDDKLVPYGTASHHFCNCNSSGWLMFFGSQTIFNTVVNLKGIVSLTTYNKKGHEKAGFLFYHQPQPILSFCNKILKGDKFQIHEIVKE